MEKEREFITCYVVPVVIPAVQGSWRAAWSSACRVSWRSVGGWVRVSREGEAGDTVCCCCETDRDRGQEAFSPLHASQTSLLSQTPEKQLRGWRTLGLQFLKVLFIKVGRNRQEVEVNNTRKRPG